MIGTDIRTSERTVIGAARAGRNTKTGDLMDHSNIVSQTEGRFISTSGVKASWKRNRSSVNTGASEPLHGWK